jgi:hypothetical protein
MTGISDSGSFYMAAEGHRAMHSPHLVHADPSMTGLPMNWLESMGFFG